MICKKCDQHSYSDTDPMCPVCGEEIKDTIDKQVIDLTGPEGNGFYLLGLARKLCKQLDLDTNQVIREMTTGSYEELITAFNKHFGSIIDLKR